MSDDPNVCPHLSCTARLNGERLFACRRHWAELTDELKAKIRADWRRHDVEAMIANYDLAEAEWA